jgi:hypothetical protein
VDTIAQEYTLYPKVMIINLLKIDFSILSNCELTITFDFNVALYKILNI